MKVRALENGFYEVYRQEGDVFEFTPQPKPKDHKGAWKGNKPGSWMEPLEEGAAPEPEATEE